MGVDELIALLSDVDGARAVYRVRDDRGLAAAPGEAGPLFYHRILGDRRA